MPITKPLHGSCFCGRNTYILTPLHAYPPNLAHRGTPPHIFYDHCSDCRKIQASLVVAWINTPASSLAFQQHRQDPSESAEEIYKLLKSSAKAERRFCGFCGTHLTYQSTEDRAKGWIDVTLGSLDEKDLQGLREGGNIRKGGEEEEKAEDEAMKKEGHHWWGSRVRWWVKQVTEEGFAKHIGPT